MLERYTVLRPRGDPPEDGSATSRMTPLRAATAQLLCATGFAAALAGLDSGQRSSNTPIRHSAPRALPEPLLLAPFLIGPLAAAAHFEHARHPRPGTKRATRLLNAAVVLSGGLLFAADLFRARRPGPGHLGAIAFSCAGILGNVLDRQAVEVDRVDRQLRRRAEIVGRLIPRRRPKIDRIVVHI